MTDRTTITINADWDLMIRPHTDGILLSLLPVRDTPAHVTVPVATGALLAAIDAADPDAMRAYLRETVESTFLENMGVPPVEREVPEADSPEDVDEQPGADFTADDELMGTRTGRLLLLQRVAHLYPSVSLSEHLVAADWILGPEPEHVEDLTLSGEDLNR